MDKFDRICQLHQEFVNRRTPVKISQLAESLECSEKTIKRGIDQLRDYLNAPLEYESEHRGWRYIPDRQHKFELPGLWMTESELVSLILLLSILETFGNGILSQEMQRTNAYISKLLKDRGLDHKEINSKIKIIPLAQKILPSKTLYAVSEALFKGRQFTINYVDYNGQTSERTVSPLTLVYYRDNWYVDAWCHLREALRTFSIARVNAVSITDKPVITINAETLSSYFSKSYGIFSGKPDHIAKLKFSPAIAREIAMQCWHLDQTSNWEDGHYLLEIPYSSNDELIMDILRYLPNVEVIEPASLNQAVKTRIDKAYEIFNK